MTRHGTSPRRRPGGSAAGVLTLTALMTLSALAGCSDGEGGSSSPAVTSAVNSPASSPATSPAVSSGGPSTAPAAGESWSYPALVEAQVVRIDDAADAALSTAITARDVAAAGARLVGPARRLLAAELTVAQARGTAPPAATRLAASRVMVPLAGPWPRWFVTAGSATRRPTPLVRVLHSASAREPFGVWAELALLPGATLPEPAGGGQGTPLLAPAATGLVMSPQQVAIGYADLLTRGTNSRFATAFAKDSFRPQLGERLAADRRRIVSTAVATISSTHAPVLASTRALRTRDGGALVIVELLHTYQVTVDAGGGVVRPDEDWAALAGRSEFTRTLRRESVEVLAFVVPPAPAGARSASDPKPTLVAAVKGDVAATGS